MNKPIEIACIDVQNQLGEGIIWDHRSQCVWWTDILNDSLFSWSFEAGLTRFTTPLPVCSFGFTETAGVLIVAFPKGFAFYHVETQQIDWIVKVEEQMPSTRLNDGRVDRQGRFWSGSMDTNDKGSAGSLYCLENRLATSQLDGINISNGLCWSKDADTIYHADSPSRTIKHAKFDAVSGKPGAWQTLVKTPKGAYPDGACIDAQNHLWSAQWGASCIRRFDQQGNEVFRLDLPCTQPSCISFGGKNLDHLFITSARVGLSQATLDAEPRNGNMMIYKLPFTGLEEVICTRI